MRKYMLMVSVAGLVAPAMVAAQDAMPTEPAANPPASAAPLPGQAPIDRMDAATNPRPDEAAMANWPAERQADTPPASAAPTDTETDTETDTDQGSSTPPQPR